MEDKFKEILDSILNDLNVIADVVSLLEFK